MIRLKDVVGDVEKISEGEFTPFNWKHRLYSIRGCNCSCCLKVFERRGDGTLNLFFILAGVIYMLCGLNGAKKENESKQKLQDRDKFFYSIFYKHLLSSKE